MSCRTRSSDELANTTPVSPPTVNKKIKPKAHNKAGEGLKSAPYRVPTQLKTLTPVGTAIIMVAEVKYARVSVSIPTVNMWWAQTTNPKTPMASIAYTIPSTPKGSDLPLSWATICEISPNPGKIRI